MHGLDGVRPVGAFHVLLRRTLASSIVRTGASGVKDIFALSEDGCVRLIRTGVSGTMDE